MTDKFDDRVGHMNNISARGAGNLNDLIFKSSNARGLIDLAGGGSMFKFRVDRRITVTSTPLFKTRLAITFQRKITLKSKLFCPSSFSILPVSND